MYYKIIYFKLVSGIHNSLCYLQIANFEAQFYSLNVKTDMLDLIIK